jgi:hypothetical protein
LKILGLTIDKGLTFNTHVSTVCQRALGIFKKLNRAAKVSWGLNPDVVRSTYVAAVEPTITYVAAAWVGAACKVGTWSSMPQQWGH